MLNEKLGDLQNVITSEDIASFAGVTDTDVIITRAKEQFNTELSAEEVQQIADIMASGASEEEIRQKMQGSCPTDWKPVKDLICNKCNQESLMKKYDYVVHETMYFCTRCNCKTEALEWLCRKCLICGNWSIYKYVNPDPGRFFHCRYCWEDRTKDEVG